MQYIFFKSVDQRAVCFAAMKWCKSIRRWFKKLNTLIKKAGSVLGTALELIEQRKMLQKLLNIMDNSAHLLRNVTIKWQRVFSQRFLQLQCNTKSYRRSFQLTAITIFYSDNWLITENLFFCGFALSSCQLRSFVKILPTFCKLCALWLLSAADKRLTAHEHLHTPLRKARYPFKMWSKKMREKAFSNKTHFCTKYKCMQ